MMEKKGFTLIELIVSMAIFTVVVTICVGAFVSASNIRALAQTQQESQQKLRMAIEMLNKYARQADRVLIAYKTSSPSTAEFYYGEPLTTSSSGIKFSIENNTSGIGKLFYQECVTIDPTSTVDPTAGFCATWSPKLDLLGGQVQLNLATSYLSISADSYVPILVVNFNGETMYNANITNPFYKDTRFLLETSVPLEGLR